MMNEAAVKRIVLILPYVSHLIRRSLISREMPAYESPVADSHKQQIMIIAGLPGSGCHALVNSLRMFASEENNWRVLEQKLEVLRVIA